MLDIRVEKTTSPKELPGKDNPLVFGTIFTDHMFIMNYTKGTNNFGSSGGGEWDNSYNSLDSNNIRTQNQNIAHTHSQVAHTHSVSGGKVTDASASNASSSHSTIPNYKYVYMWERTA